MPLKLVPEPKTKKEQFEEECRRRWSQKWSEEEPFLNASSLLEKERLFRTLELIESHAEGNNWLDVGCGFGHLAKTLALQGKSVTALDVASYPLKQLEKAPLEKVEGCFPYLSFQDEAFDCLIATDLFAELDATLYRLSVSEAARLIKKNGYFITSTSLDYHTLDADRAFRSLLETEFHILKERLSYHRLFLSIQTFFNALLLLKKASRCPHAKERMLEGKKGGRRYLVALLAHPLFHVFWWSVERCSRPFKKKLENSRRIYLLLEKLSRLFWGRGGASHMIVIAKIRPFNV